MDCGIPEERLWSWIDDNASELESHLARCPRCRELAAQIRVGMNAAALGAKSLGTPLPERIGSYTVIRLLGEGGQGIVYEAQQQSPRRAVALKVLKGGRFANRHDLRRFEREAQALAALNHAGTAAVYEAGRTEEGLPFFAMELVDGLPLDVYVRRSGLPREQRLELFGGVCEVVQYAHDQGVIHRDLKPTNILINAEGDPKVVDFGLARITEADVTLTSEATETGQVKGTLRYMSPEQVSGRTHEIGFRSDVYALGVILYELLTDRPPYEISRFMPDAVRTICDQPPQRPSSITRSLRGDLETITLKALDKEPSQRYPSVGELGRDVGRYLAGEPIQAKPPSGFYLFRKKLHKHQRRVGFVAAVVAFALIALWGRQQWTAHNYEQRIFRARRGIPYELDRVERGSSKYDLAIAESLYRMHPELPDAQVLRVKAVWAYGSFGQAEDFLNDRIEDGPPQWRWVYRTLLADMKAAKEGGAGGPERIEAEAPDPAEAWYLRSLITWNTSEAIELAETAVDRDPTHDLGWNRLAYVYRRAGDYNAAREAARQLTNLAHNPSAWILFEGDVLLLQGECDEAIERYTHALELDPGMLTAYRQRALAYLCRKDYPKACKNYTWAMEGQRTVDIAWEQYFRATPRWIDGRWLDAESDYLAFHQSRTVYASFADIRRFLVLRDYASNLESNGQTESAKEAGKKADRLLRGLTANPESLEAQILDCLKGELTPSELVDTANPENREVFCEVYYYAGEAELLARRPNEARQWFEKCVKTNLMFDQNEIPLDPMSEYHLAVWRLDQLAAEAEPALREEEG